MEFGRFSSVVQAVAYHAATTPDALCMADKAKSLTYAQAWEQVSGLAQHLSQGVGQENYVLVSCNQSVEFMVAMLGCHLAGVIPVPLERNAARDREREILGETHAALYIGPKAPAELDVPFLGLDQVGAFPIPEQPLPFPAADAVSEVLFSTGTTGKSKGIVLTQASNMAIAEGLVDGLRMKPGNVEIILMPLSHSHGLRRTYANLLNGSAAVFADGVLALKKVFDLMDTYQVSAMDLAPSMLSIVFKLSQDRLGDYADVLDYVQLGSAPLPEEDKAHLKRIMPGVRLYNIYGTTEAGCSCIYDFGTEEERPHCIGRPSAHARFVVVDENRQPVESSAENPGLLATTGAITMKEYFNAPELTAKTLVNGYLYTNDLGYVDEQGYVYMLGRKDDVINFGGVKISPEEIESAVKANPLVKDCACVPVKDAVAGQIPKLFVVVQDEASFDLREFKKFLGHVIDANKQPQRIQVIDAIPRTYNGKIKRKELAGRQ
ncbi:MAG: class I adenylate-forming enzyme family protein [Eggerthellales bacterium]|nr:class I adenylate-forming enzyme family protein [Eggerthellales bacterium]